MNRIVKLSLALALVSQTGFALPGMELAQKALASHFARGQANAAPTQCADFNGSWKGKCDVDGNSTDLNLAIRQEGCKSLSIGDNYLAIGGSDTRSLAMPVGDKGAMSVATVAFYEWNAEGTQLNSSFGGAVKFLGEGKSLPLVGKSVMKLDGAKLVAETEILNLKATCTFEK